MAATADAGGRPPHAQEFRLGGRHTGLANGNADGEFAVGVAFEHAAGRRHIAVVPAGRDDHMALAGEERGTGALLTREIAQ